MGSPHSGEEIPDWEWRSCISYGDWTNISVVDPIETTENKGTSTSLAPKNVAYLIHMGKAAKKVFVK